MTKIKIQLSIRQKIEKRAVEGAFDRINNAMADYLKTHIKNGVSNQIENQIGNSIVGFFKEKTPQFTFGRTTLLEKIWIEIYLDIKKNI
jgi:hypothetical protein